jgi:RND family efflux transporter MFP subunit
MKRWLIVIIAVLLAGGALAANTASTRAGKYTVELSSRPSPPVVGENLLVITIKEGEKPLANAGVDVHIDMTTMPMPADAKAAPGRDPGEYGATVNLSMEGAWKVDVAVQQMAGMKMDGDGTAHFLIETGKGITAQGGGAKFPWTVLLIVLLAAVILGTIIFYRRLPVHVRSGIVGVLTLVVVLAGTIFIVNKYRDKKTSTVIGSAFMDMSAQAAPGTTAVFTVTVAPMPFQATATYTGTVVPDVEEDVYPRVTGRLVSMPFYPGDRITPGQVVAQLDTSELAAKEAQAAFGNLNAVQGINAADADVRTAQAERTKAQRGVDQAKALLGRMQAEVRGAEGAVKAAQSELTATERMAEEADSAVASAQSGIDQADEMVIQAESEVVSAQADVTYWETEIARAKKLYELGAIAKEELDRATAQAATATAKLNQTKAGVRSAQAGVAKAKQELAQARSRAAAARAAISSARARVEQAQADRDSANGQVLEAQAGVETAQAEVSAAEAGVNSATVKVGQARASSQQAKAALTEARTVSGYTTIRASSGGVVTARNISPGVLVQPGMSILKIARIDYVRIQANVSEADLAGISVGQALTAHSISAPNAPIAGRVTTVFPASDTTARTAIVEARVPNPGYRLKPGQYLTVEIGLGNTAQQVLAVPTAALAVRDGQSSLFIVEDDGLRKLAKRIGVMTGRVNNDQTEITGGLQPGAEVITSGLANLHDGAAVTVLQEDVPAASPAKAPAASLPMSGMEMTSPLPKPKAAPTQVKPALAQAKPSPAKAKPTPAPATPAATADYSCPMHPEVTSTKPGKCPKCGMDLVKKEAAKATEAVYVCPMHPEVTANKPDTCPKCGMDLVKKD